MQRRTMVAMLAAGIMAQRTAAVVRGQTPTPATVRNLAPLLPTPFDPAVTLVEAGALSAAELAATFHDPADATHLLATWGWLANAYRVYEIATVSAATPGPTGLEVSLHEFARSTGAAVALGYFVHGREVMLGGSEQPIAQGGPCDVILAGETSVTRYVRGKMFLLRVTAVVRRRPLPFVLMAGMPLTAEVADVFLQSPGTSLAELDQSCQ